LEKPRAARAQASASCLESLEKTQSLGQQGWQSQQLSEKKGMYKSRRPAEP
tara:strand:- start:376 stop:528 length:153 start_codon:yes stop_codon:yes gene_type:complete